LSSFISQNTQFQCKYLYSTHLQSEAAESWAFVSGALCSFILYWWCSG